MKTRQKGMSIVIALFVVVVVASLAAFAVTVGGAQRQTDTTNMQGSRALAAARSGLEWGIYRARSSGWCNTPNVQQVVPLTEGALRGFTVTVTCRGYQHTEGGPPYYSFDISATSRNGTYGAVDFASRTVSGRYFAPGF